MVCRWAMLSVGRTQLALPPRPSTGQVVAGSWAPAGLWVDSDPHMCPCAILVGPGAVLCEMSRMSRCAHHKAEPLTCRSASCAPTTWVHSLSGLHLLLSFALSRSCLARRTISLLKAEWVKFFFHLRQQFAQSWVHSIEPPVGGSQEPSSGPGMSQLSYLPLSKHPQSVLKHYLCISLVSSNT